MTTLFETFLLELAKVLQFPSLAPDAKGACLIIMRDGNVPLLFEFDEQLVPNTVLLSTPIAAIPIGYLSDIYEACLKGNHSIEDTLSVKPDEDILHLHCRFHPEIQSVEIEQRLQNFLKTSREWKVKVEEITTKPPGADRIPAHPSSIQVFPYKA